MVKFYLRSLCLLFATISLLPGLIAQTTTLTTAGATSGYDLSSPNGLPNTAFVTFVVENNNGYPIVINGLEDYRGTTYPVAAGGQFSLWYSSTSLGGAVSITQPTWTPIDSITVSSLAIGYNTIFTNLGFTMPAGAQYRFALICTGGMYYSSAGVPSSFTGGGVNLRMGSETVGSDVIGYSGYFPNSSNSPRFFTGSITFQPAGPCTSPPVPGYIKPTVNGDSATSVCNGASVGLRIIGGTGGTGQTYQWQSSTNGATYNNISSATSASYIATQTATTYYRASISCGGLSANTAPVQITTPSLVSGTYTINNAVATGGNNFQNFADAINYIKCGINGPVVFNVAASSGPYNEQVTIPQIFGTSATNTITIKGNNRVLNFNSTNTNERAGIKLDGADYVRIDSLIINGTGTTTSDYNFGIQLLNDADFNTINSCAINVTAASSSSNFAGIAISGSATSATGTGSLCDNNTISNNTVTGGYYGITVIGTTTSGSFIAGNRVTNNTVNDFYFYGIYISGTTGTSVMGNDINRRNRTVSLTTFYGIYFTGLSENAAVAKNRIHDPFGGITTSATGSIYGIALSSTDASAGRENIVSNNLLYNFTNGGTIYALYNSSSDNADFYHNTVSLQDSGYTGTGTTYGFYQLTSATGIDIKNNIIYIARGGTATKYCLYFGTAASTITSNNNDLVMAAASGTANNIGFYSMAYNTMAGWQGAGYDVASVNTLPVFSAPGSSNFQPTAMALDNMGTPVGISTDIINSTRSATTPDIGAYEFGAPLPIKLLSIAASKLGKDVLVNWTSAAEINFSHYELERSADAVSFTKIGSLVSNGRSGTNTYSYNDAGIASAATGKAVYYRLKMIDRDGKWDYSKVVMVSLSKDAIAFVKTYPSPFTNELYVQIETAQTTTMQALLSDAAGKILFTKNYNVVRGNNLVMMDGLDKLQKGTYLLTVIANGEHSTTKVVK